MGLIWLAVGIALLAFPRQSQTVSRRFEEGKTLIPFPPLVGLPLWAVRFFGVISLGDAGLFFYLLFR
ncbi:MAG TPA: hypothetical protein VMG82_21670 [Candidatus Sulfotelmatobacter sp.]|nr:hypothetical protein [Candidatus Sulfotelmatobacter sp.]